jgi:orotidine-5'-phosphate decarboxylase
MKTKLIVALDLGSFQKAKKIVNLLYPKVKIFKVGLQLFTCCGPKIVNWLVKKKIKVFLDLKLYDIPHTLEETVKLFCKMKVFMFTVHLQAGKEALLRIKEAVFKEAKKLKIKRPLICGVTILTSQKIDHRRMRNLIKIAEELGLDGIVASAKDIDFIRKNTKKRFIIVSPGIRIEKVKSDDQKRIATPKEAKLKKIDYIVVGRPILEVDNPKEKVNQILEQLK